MNTNIQFETTDLRIVKTKIAAYRLLFDIEPVLFIRGQWLDKQNERVFFFRQQEIPFENIGRLYIMASVDGEPFEKIRPISGAGFEISWK